MSYRFMRVCVLFDLPIGTSAERRQYTQFRRFLLKNGFMMLQQSVYCKLALNTTAANAIMANVRKHKPTDGLVQMLTITEKQFSRMELLIGEQANSVLNDDRRLVII